MTNTLDKEFISTILDRCKEENQRELKEHTNEGIEKDITAIRGLNDNQVLYDARYWYLKGRQSAYTGLQRRLFTEGKD